MVEGYPGAMEHIAVMTAQQVKAWLDRGDDFLLIDVLPEASYEKRHLPKALNAPVHEDDFLERVERLSDDGKRTTIVVYCSSHECSSSPMAAKALAQAGYSAVYDYEDGLAGWITAGYDFA